MKNKLNIFIPAVCFTALSVVWVAWKALLKYINSPYVSLKDDIDWGYINNGLSHIHGLHDTLRWWTGDWCMELPFWRPLTSYVFWWMRLLWPENYFLPRQIILVILHVLMVALGAALLYRLTKRKWLVLLTIYLFAGHRPDGMLVPVNSVLSDPKNIPEPLTGLCVLGSLFLLAEGRWAGALAVAVLGVCFKELGFVTWPMALIMLAWLYRKEILSGRWEYVRDSIKRNRTAVLFWVALFGAMLVIHFACVGLGYRIGTNRHWAIKALGFYGGPFVCNIIARRVTLIVLPIFIVLTAWYMRGRSLLARFLSLLCTVGFGIVVESVSARSTLDAAMVVVVSILAVDILYLCIWLAAACCARRDLPAAVFGMAMCIVSAAPAWMATQTLIHTRYLAALFMEMAVSAALIQACLAMRRLMPEIFSSKAVAMKTDNMAEPAVSIKSADA